MIFIIDAKVYKLNKHKHRLCKAERVNSTSPDSFSCLGYDKYNIPPMIGYDKWTISCILTCKNNFIDISLTKFNQRLPQGSFDKQISNLLYENGVPGRLF